MSNNTPRIKPENELIDLVQKFEGQIKLALPKHLTASRMTRIIMTEIRKNPDLAKCNRASFFGAIIQCAQLGLEPGNALGHAYLIPYKTECQLIIGYQGKIELAERDGRLSLDANVVYEKDVFEYEGGSHPKLVHKPYMGKEDPGDVIGSYAIARYTNGTIKVHVCPLHVIEKARRSSKARYKGCPWDEHYGEMAMKTAVHRLFKRLPKNPEMQKAQEIDDAAEIGGTQEMSNVFLEFKEQNKLPEIGINDEPIDIEPVGIPFNKEDPSQKEAVTKILTSMEINTETAVIIIDELHNKPESQLMSIIKKITLRNEG